MKPLGTLRREILGAWRSVRYDLDRRADADAWEESAPPPGRAPAAARESVARESVLTALRDPRRVGAAAGVASIIAASATGTYFAVIGGLGLVIADAAGVPVVPRSAPFAPFAPLAPAPPAATSKTPPRQHHHRPGHRSPARPTAPTPAPPPAAVVAIDEVRPAPSTAPVSAAPRRSPVPESTMSAPPPVSPSVSISPSPLASVASRYPLPNAPH